MPSILTFEVQNRDRRKIETFLNFLFDTYRHTGTKQKLVYTLARSFWTLSEVEWTQRLDFEIEHPRKYVSQPHLTSAKWRSPKNRKVFLFLNFKNYDSTRLRSGPVGPRAHELWANAFLYLLGSHSQFSGHIKTMIKLWNLATLPVSHAFQPSTYAQQNTWSC